MREGVLRRIFEPKGEEATGRCRKSVGNSEGNGQLGRPRSR
jgi:hypothetical protein